MSKSHEPLVTYAQNREDLIIGAFFPEVEKGFYVDVGANHPINDSVTKAFYERGWHGINIEPIKALYEKLSKDRPRDINLEVGVSGTKGMAKFIEFENDGLSTLSQKTVKEYKKQQKVKSEYEVEVDTLSSIFKENKVKHVHFLKIDIEGYEYEAIKGNNWEKYRPELICIEANHVDKDWRPILIDNNYSLVFFDGLNEYYLRNESSKREEYFLDTYPSLLVDSPIVSYGWKVAIDLTSEQLEKVQAALNSNIALIDKLENDIKIHQAELEKYTSIGYLLKCLKLQVKNRLTKR